MTDQTLHLGLEQEAEGITTLTLMPNPSNERGGVVVLDEWLLDQLGLAFDSNAGKLECAVSHGIGLSGRGRRRVQERRRTEQQTEQSKTAAECEQK